MLQMGDYRYTSGLLVMKLGVTYWLALPIAGVFAALVGLLVGLSSLRLRGFYFAIATFVFSQIVIIILRAWTPVTGGMSGMFGLPVPSEVCCQQIELSGFRANDLSGLPGGAGRSP